MRAWLPSLLVAATGWGSSFLFIEWGLNAFSPTQVGFGRLVIGASVLLVVVAVTRAWPQLTWRQVSAIAVVGIAMSGAPMVLIPMAQQDITSILASLLNATTPLWTAAFVALLIPHERATRAQLLGLGLGVVGIAVLVGAWDVREFSPRGTALMLVATSFYGIGATLSRILLGRIEARPTAISMVQVGLSSLMLAPLALAAPQPPPEAFSLTQTALWGVLGLGVVGTSFSYVMFWRVNKIAGATTAASVTYLSPIVALVLGVVVLGEHLRWHEPVGALVVFAGVYLASRTSRRAKLATATTPGTSEV